MTPLDRLASVLLHPGRTTLDMDVLDALIAVARAADRQNEQQLADAGEYHIHLAQAVHLALTALDSAITEAMGET